MLNQIEIISNLIFNQSSCNSLIVNKVFHRNFCIRLIINHIDDYILEQFIIIDQPSDQIETSIICDPIDLNTKLVVLE